MAQHTQELLSLQEKARRTFILSSALVGTTLVVGYNFNKEANAQPSNTAHSKSLNAWIEIHPDNQMTIVVSQAEMGQGIQTTLPALIADEIGADWSLVSTRPAPLKPAYRQPVWGWQVTGGATSTSTFYLPLRTAAAAAREMLLSAAQRLWQVPANELSIENSVIQHAESGRRATFGELAEQASNQPVPNSPSLRPGDQFKLIGKSIPRRDTASKTDGTAQFGIDVMQDNLLHAAILQAPVFGSSLTDVDATDSLKMSGVVKVIKMESAVAVVAQTWWQAKKAIGSLKPVWTEPESLVSTASLVSQYQNALDTPGQSLPVVGPEIEMPTKWAIEQEYVSPFQAHATLEPQNCTAQVSKAGCTLWAPTQNPETGQKMVAHALGLPSESIKVHQTLLGGGFGRRLAVDYMVQAALIAREVSAPVKLLWDREQDTQHDFYRPLTINRIAATLNAEGFPVAIRHRVASSDWLKPAYPPEIHSELSDYLAFGLGLPFDLLAVEGLDHLPYHPVSYFNEISMQEIAVPTAVWRGTGYGTSLFAFESFVDELAAKADKDPLDYRRKMMANSPSQRAVLEAAARAIGWNNKVDSHGYGIAYAHAFGSFVAQAVEISVVNKEIKVHRVVTAIDCGLVLNPDIVRQQMEGGVIWSLNAALNGPIEIKEGKTVQSNFHQYRMLTLKNTPEIEVVFIDSDRDPTGVGEAGVVAFPAALANAIYNATGQRLRQMPFILSA